MEKYKLIRFLAFSVAVFILSLNLIHPAQAEITKSDSVGLQATISSEPPKVGATISLPTNGQFFSVTPINVTGICPKDLLVKVYKNNVFGGSSQCSSQGTFSLQVDLFPGTNDLVARVYDALDQAGPDSNTVTIRYNDSLNLPSVSRLILTSNYATKGANPGEKLNWPFIISGGTGPYALAVDWGDQVSSPYTSLIPGEISATHTYDKSGVYTVVVRATDSKGSVAYLQVVGVANGKVEQTQSTTKDESRTLIRYIIWPLIVLLPVILLTFWLASRHENRRLRHMIARGEQPFQ